MKPTKDKLHVYYDLEGDMLEIRVGEPTLGYMKDLGNEVFECVDQETGKVKGFVILNFIKRKRHDGVDIPLPVRLEVLA